MLGRGTDFVCHDETVINNGGIHVIQTFLSEELSEEVQIKGRSARQGDPGSYAMILLDHSLEKFLITLEDLENVRKGKPLYVRIWDKFKTHVTHKNFFSNISLIHFLSFIKIIKKFETNIKNF